MKNNSYLFSLDYGNRKDERVFVGKILDIFNRDSFAGAM